MLSRSCWTATTASARRYSGIPIAQLSLVLVVVVVDLTALVAEQCCSWELLSNVKRVNLTAFIFVLVYM
jgi:hypothetical protein